MKKKTIFTIIAAGLMTMCLSSCFFDEPYYDHYDHYHYYHHAPRYHGGHYYHYGPQADAANPIE
ncbi:MAG: hypothetical protein HUK05_00805 [Prevotella sp.]|nr:hypothetical protein [Prevotella sp.]MCF0208298.1 hypothetical protein [Bacteroidaceae bacterium]